MKINKKSLLILLLIFLLTGISSASIKDEIENYVKTRSLVLVASHTKSEGHFKCFIVPAVPQDLLAHTYLEYLEKRYSKKIILQKTKELLIVGKDKLDAVFSINFIGDWQSKGETSKEIPDDFAEYLFLENDKEDFTRCTKTDIPFGGNIINTINNESIFRVTFALTYEKNGKQFSILEDTEYIEFVVGGLGLKDNRFRYRLPLFVITKNTPQPLKELFIELGLSQYPPGIEIDEFDQFIQEIQEELFANLLVSEKEKQILPPSPRENAPPKLPYPKKDSTNKKILQPKIEYLPSEEEKTLSEKRKRGIRGPLGEGRKIELQIKPIYPEWIREKGITGIVEVKCWVLPSGEVRNAEVCQSSGSPELDDLAAKYLMMWKFEPIKERKIQWGIVPFVFEYKSKE